MSAARAGVSAANWQGMPVSSVCSALSSSLSLRMAWLTSTRRLRRRLAGTERHPARAARAAATASAISRSPARATAPLTRPVAGSMCSHRPPLDSAMCCAPTSSVPIGGGRSLPLIIWSHLLQHASVEAIDLRRPVTSPARTCRTRGGGDRPCQKAAARTETARRSPDDR